MTSEPRRIHLSRAKGWRLADHSDHVKIVDRRTKWGNPFRLRTRTALARVPAVTYPDQTWEFEGRISADGTRHDYFHPGGKVTVCHVRYMTAEEAVLCYRALLLGGGWPLDWKPRPGVNRTAEEARTELAGWDLACWCPPEQACHVDALLEVANSTFQVLPPVIPHRPPSALRVLSLREPRTAGLL